MPHPSGFDMGGCLSYYIYNQVGGISAYVRRFEQQNKLQQHADIGMLVDYGHEVTNQKG